MYLKMLVKTGFSKSKMCALGRSDSNTVDDVSLPLNLSGLKCTRTVNKEKMQQTERKQEKSKSLSCECSAESKLVCKYTVMECLGTVFCSEI